MVWKRWWEIACLAVSWSIETTLQLFCQHRMKSFNDLPLPFTTCISCSFWQTERNEKELENAVKGKEEPSTQKINNNEALRGEHIHIILTTFYHLMRLLKRLLNPCLSIGRTRDFFTLNDQASSYVRLRQLLYSRCILFAFAVFWVHVFAFCIKGQWRRCPGCEEWMEGECLFFFTRYKLKWIAEISICKEKSSELFAHSSQQGEHFQSLPNYLFRFFLVFCCASSVFVIFISFTLHCNGRPEAGVDSTLGSGKGWE